MVAARAAFVALLAVSACRKSPPPPAATVSWAGCSAAREHAAINVECGDDLLLTVARTTLENAGNPQLQRAALTEARRVLTDDVELTGRNEQPLAGAGLAEAFDYRLTEKGVVESGRGLLAVASEGSRTVVTVLCIDRRAGGVCAPMTTEILLHGVPAALLPDAAAAAPLRFNGRDLSIPPGCTSHTGEDLACGTAHLRWTQVTGDTLANAGDTFYDGMMGAQGMPPPDFTAELRCAIDGVATTCRRRIWARNDNRLGIAISAAARVRGEPTAMVCFWTVGGEAADVLPPACAALLTIVSE